MVMPHFYTAVVIMDILVLRAMTCLHVGDTGTGKSWLLNLLIILSIVDRFTYIKMNKVIIVYELEAYLEIIER